MVLSNGPTDPTLQVVGRVSDETVGGKPAAHADRETSVRRPPPAGTTPPSTSENASDQRHRLVTLEHEAGQHLIPARHEGQRASLLAALVT